jgi:hypothetical protein
MKNVQILKIKSNFKIFIFKYLDFENYKKDTTTKNKNEKIK